MLRKTLFTIDGTEAIFEGYTDGSHWNGWACPWFTKEVADKIARIVNKEHLSELDGKAMYYLQETDTFQYEPFGEDMREEFQGKDIDGLHLYPIGNMAWAWDDLAEYQSEQSKMLMTYLREEYFWLNCEQLYDVYYGIAQEIDGYMSDEQARTFADGFVAAYGRRKSK